MTKTEEYLKIIAEQLIQLNQTLKSNFQPKTKTEPSTDHSVNIGSTGFIESDL